MDRRQLGITITAVVLALVLGAGVALLATSGSDDESRTANAPTTTSTRGTSTTPTSTTSTTTGPGIVTVPTLTPGTIVIIPPTPPTTHPKRKRTRPQRTTTTTPPATVGPAATIPPTTAPPTTTPPTTAPPTTAPPTTAATAAEPTSATTTTTTTTAPAAASDIGISRHKIRLAVIADDDEVLDGARAWETVVNRRGGIADRKVRLDLLSTEGTTEGYATAVTTACDRDFAIVATLSAFDADTALLDCGIPDIPVEAISPEHLRHETTYAAFPRREGTEAVGPYRYLRSALDDCCAQYVLVPDQEPERAATESAIAAATEIGFDTVATPDIAFDAPATDYDAFAQDLLASDATFVASGLGRDSTIALRRASVGAGVSAVSAWYCDARCYDTTFVSEGGAAVDSEYIGIETVPFGDRRQVPALRSYVAATEREDMPRSYEGLRAYVAGLLVEQAMHSVVEAHGGDGLTRTALLEALAGIHDFTAGGIVGPTDVGARAPNGCTVVLQVKAGRFTRAQPAERGSLDCDTQNLVELHT